jgi:hypothetical protein
MGNSVNEKAIHMEEAVFFPGFVQHRKMLNGGVLVWK